MRSEQSRKNRHGGSPSAGEGIWWQAQASGDGSMEMFSTDPCFHWPEKVSVLLAAVLSSPDWMSKRAQLTNDDAMDLF